MAYLMRYHIGLREVPGRTEPALQIVIERKVDIHSLVRRTIERPHRRLTRAARSGRGAPEQHELGLWILPPGTLENLIPNILGIGEHLADELSLEVVVVCNTTLARQPRHILGPALPVRPRHVGNFQPAAGEQRQRIDAEHQAHDAN